MASTFSRVSDGLFGILEWTNTAHLRDGSDITYAGVSLLDLNDDGRVTRFSTYDDTRIFQPDPTTT